MTDLLAPDCLYEALHLQNYVSLNKMCWTEERVAMLHSNELS